MKPGWEIKPLGEICDSINGLWKGKKEPFVQVGVIRNTNFTKDCLLDISDIVYLDVEQKAFSKRSLTKGDIIIERSGGGPKQPVGRAVLFDIEPGDFSFSNFTSILRLKNGIKISYYYLHKYLSYFYLSGKTECMQSNVIGIRNLDFDRYKNEVLVPFPSLSEQERIVGILDRAFAKIEIMHANAAQNLQNAKDLFQASLKQELTPKQDWNKYLLKDVALDFSRGKSKHRPRNDKKLFGGEYPFIQTGEIRNANKYIGRHSVTYNEFGLSQSKLWNAGTVCITIAANIAETAILSFASCFPDSVIGVFPDTKKTSSDFLYYLLQYSKLKLQELGKGSAQDNINLGTFENMPFSFPSLHKQQSIIAKLDALSERCRAMEENYRHTLTACNDLKQALLKKAFNGEL